MFKLIKYEIKGSYKFFLGVLLTIGLASFFIQYNHRYNILNNYVTPGSGILLDLFLGISLIAIYILAIAIFIYIVNQFRKELNEDRSYLTFTLPLTGYQIIAAKFITAIIFMITAAGVFIICNQLLTSILFMGSLKNAYPIWDNLINTTNLKLGLFTFISLLSNLLLMYLAITISKITLRNRKLGGLWFIIYIILNMVTSIFLNLFSKSYPLFMNIDTFDFTSSLSTHDFFNQSSLLSFPLFNNVLTNTYFGSNIYLSIPMLIGTIIIIIAAFSLTGYLLDKRIDL